MSETITTRRKSKRESKILSIDNTILNFIPLRFDLIDKLCATLEQTCLGEPDLFSEDFNVAECRPLWYQYTEEIDLIEFSDVEHTIIAGSLLLYLDEQPTPLIPYEMFEPTSGDDDKEMLATIEQIPEEVRAIFSRLLQLFQSIINHSETNKFTPERLGRIVGPYLIKAKASQVDVERTSQLIARILRNAAESIAILSVEKRILGDPPPLHENDWNILLADSKTLTCQENEVIFEERSSISNMYRITSGKIRMEKRQIDVEILCPFQTFGEECLLDSFTHSYSSAVVHETPTMVQVISKSAIQTSTAKNPELFMKFTWNLAYKLGKMLEGLPTAQKEWSQKRKKKRIAALKDKRSSTVLTSPLGGFSGTNLSDLSIEGKRMSFVPRRKPSMTVTPAQKASPTTKENAKEYQAKLNNRSGKLVIFPTYFAHTSKLLGLEKKKIFHFKKLSIIMMDKDVILVHHRKKKDVVKFKFPSYNEAKEVHLKLIEFFEVSKANGLADEEVDIDENENSPLKNTAEANQPHQNGSGVEEDWPIILLGGSTNHFQKDQIILQEGERLQKLYQIIRGSARVEITFAGEQYPKVVDRIYTDDTFGELSFLLGHGATATVIADEDDVEIYEIKQDYLKRLFKSQPALAGRFYKYLAKILESRLRLREEKFLAESDQQDFEASIHDSEEFWQLFLNDETVPNQVVDVNNYEKGLMDKEILANFNLELGCDGVSMDSLKHFDIIHRESDFRYFKDILHQKPHSTYMCIDKDLGPVIISVEDSHYLQSKNLKALVRYAQFNERIVVPYQKKKKFIPEAGSGLIDGQEFCPKLANAKLIKLDESLQAEIDEELLEFEEKSIINTYKFGVLYCKDSQFNEDEMYCNEQGSEAFDQFLNLLGNRVVLNRFQYFRGGLDVKTNTTGKNSVYTEFKNYRVMFHVSTLLPFTPGDPQQVERKRHLGNDIVVIIFKEGSHSINPAKFRTHFTQIWIVVEPIFTSSGETMYKVNIANKKGVGLYPPPLPSPPIFSDGATFRNFLLSKLINSERAAMVGEEFRPTMTRTRKTILSNLVTRFLPKQKKSLISWGSSFILPAKTNKKTLE